MDLIRIPGPNDIDFGNGIVVNATEFEKVLRITESRIYWSRLQLAKYLKSLGFTNAVTLTLAWEQWHKL